MGMPPNKILLWKCIRTSRTDYDQTDNDPTTKGFIKWLADTWGIKITLAQDGYNLSHEADIISPDKYTMFMLKYG